MRNVKFTISLDGTATLTDEFLFDMWEQAAAEDATPFLRQLREASTLEDGTADMDAFAVSLVKQNVRTSARLGIADSFHAVGQGLKLAPAYIAVQDVPIEEPEDE